MKRMTKLLLIHWHYFTHEIIAFEQLNFLTGKNASGKSTIIDALQLILLGDTSGSFFNKAATGKGNRSLFGYLRGELGDDEDMGFKHLRNGRFTSYIALEFWDEEKQKKLTAGCCFDTYSENDMQKLFFQYDGEIPANEFVEQKIPMDIPSLRAFLKEQYTRKNYTTEVGRDFRTHLYGKLGGLREQFGRLLKKAVSFNPNVDIQQFISEFVCDMQENVDVSQMQDNIRSYKRLEKEAEVLKDRILCLEQILNAHHAYTTHKQNEKLYDYLIDCAKADVKVAEMKAEQAKEIQLAEQVTTLAEIILEEDRRNQTLQEEHNLLQVKLLNNEQAQALHRIDAQIVEKEKQIATLQEDYQTVYAVFSKCISAWQLNTAEMIRKIALVQENLIEPLLLERVQVLYAEGQSFAQKIKLLLPLDADKIRSVGENGWKAYVQDATALKKSAIGLHSRMEEEQTVLAKQRTALQQEKHSLEQGIYHFPQDALDLKEAIAAHLRLHMGKEIQVWIAAEAAEVKNDRWRNVIEGYLHTQKYYIIVPQEHLKEAIRVFDAIKRKKALYGTGIVDIEKLKSRNPVAEVGSLAEEIETTEPDVRIFLDYVLGRVKKCEKAEQLRQFRTAVTDEGVLYQNFVIRAMNPERWAKPAIGQGAIRRRLEDVKREMNRLVSQIDACAAVLIGVQSSTGLPEWSETEISHALSAAKGISAVPSLEIEIASLQESRDAMDQSTIVALETRIREVRAAKNVLEEQWKAHSEERATKIEQLRVCREEKIPQFKREWEALQYVVAEKYAADWVDVTGSVRYQRELSVRGNPVDIYKAFPRELSKAANARERMWEELLDWRRSYNDKYIMGYSIKSEDNDIYDNAWLELSENKLPEYLARIEDTREKAFEQFQEDFLSRLQDHIKAAHRQIDGLNTALSGSSFGEDTYRFRIIPKPEYKRYYDMIVDPMLLEGGYNLLAEQFRTKYKDEIAELFAIITNENASAKEYDQEDYEKRVKAFTDYRTYLSFDLEVINRDGEAQRLSKTLGKKSGGETQTPFYIAVLASFAQLYRVGRDKRANTSRLIIFDEAFSKMDGERIVRSVELLRQFDFQVILSAPPDKVGDIATLVDRNLCVLRDGKHSCVRYFDPKQLEEIVYE